MEQEQVSDIVGRKLFHYCEATKNGGGVDLCIVRNGETFVIHLLTDSISRMHSLSVQGESTPVLVEYETDFDLSQPITETPDDLRRERMSREFDRQQEQSEREAVKGYLGTRSEIGK